MAMLITEELERVAASHERDGNNYTAGLLRRARKEILRCNAQACERRLNLMYARRLDNKRGLKDG
jgi:hypothetical protein